MLTYLRKLDLSRGVGLAWLPMGIVCKRKHLKLFSASETNAKQSCIQVYVEQDKGVESRPKCLAHYFHTPLESQQQ